MWKRLSHGFLVVTILLVLAATLLPDEPTGEVEWSQVLCVLCGRRWLADALANLALFLPLGLALGLRDSTFVRALLFAAALSFSVESAQFFIPGRDPSLSDFLFNTLGAALGLGIVRFAPKWARPEGRVAARLSLLAALTIGAVFFLTDVLLRAALPDTPYLGGSADVQPSDKPLRLGGNTEPREYFRGRIDEVRVFRSARTASEIRSDLATPVIASGASADLVAAYSFDEGFGTTLKDISGHGNTGSILGGTWTKEGRFGGALAFDGVHDVVVVPHSTSLGLSRAMTLEAWIYPTAVQRGWRAVLQKEFDMYFLFAGSRSGALRPGGGGTFGLLTETMAAPAIVPLNAWTHVALTYDGATLELYLNGRSVSRRLRWYPGRIIQADVGGLPIAAGVVPESRQLRSQLLSGAPLRVRAMVAAPVASRAPLVTLQNASRREILLLAAEQDDVVFRIRTRAAAAELDSPAIRAAGILRGLQPGTAMTLTVSRRGRGYCVGVDGRSMCGLGYTLGMGWTFFIYSQVPPGWLHSALNGGWMAAVLFPFGFWLRYRWESLAAGLTLIGCAVVACTVGHLGASWLEIGAAILGIAAGSACALGLARFGGSCGEAHLHA